jgi:hypothetical protein
MSSLAARHHKPKSIKPVGAEESVSKLSVYGNDQVGAGFSRPIRAEARTHLMSACF